MSIISSIESLIKPYKVKLAELLVYAENNIPQPSLADFYPVGSVYHNYTTEEDPSTLLGFGTWVRIPAGTFLLGEGGGYTLGQTGGAATHQLTTAQLPSHNHSISNIGTYQNGSTPLEYANDGAGSRSTGSAGSSSPHNNLHPYRVVAMWRRTA